jgi:hypothetical protein
MQNNQKTLNNNNRLVLRLRWCVAKHDFALFCVIEKKVCTSWSDVRPWTLSGCCCCARPKPPGAVRLLGRHSPSLVLFYFICLCVICHMEHDAIAQRLLVAVREHVRHLAAPVVDGGAPLRMFQGGARVRNGALDECGMAVLLATQIHQEYVQHQLKHVVVTKIMVEDAAMFPACLFVWVVLHGY